MGRKRLSKDYRHSFHGVVFLILEDGVLERLLPQNQRYAVQVEKMVGSVPTCELRAFVILSPKVRVEEHRLNQKAGITMNNILNSRFAGPNSPTDLQVGYFVMRLMLGINLTFHGIMRPITGMNAFVEQWVPSFADTFLPISLVRMALYFIPIAELIVGILTLLGLFTRWALIGGVMIFALLLAGQGVRSNWGGIHLVMQYVLYYVFLFSLRSQNWLALDNRRSAAT